MAQQQQRATRPAPSSLRRPRSLFTDLHHRMKALSHAIFLRHYQDGESQPLLMMMMMATLSTTPEDLPSPLAAPPSSRFPFATPRAPSEAEDSPSKRALAQRVSAGRHAQPREPRVRLHADGRHRRIHRHARRYAGAWGSAAALHALLALLVLGSSLLPAYVLFPRYFCYYFSSLFLRVGSP